MTIGSTSVRHIDHDRSKAARSDIPRLQFASFAEYTDAAYGFVSDRMQPFVGTHSNVCALEELTGLYRCFEEALYSVDGKNEEGLHYSAYVCMDSLVRFYHIFQNTDISDLICYRFYICTDEAGKLIFMFENTDSTVSNPWDLAGVCAGIECLLERAYRHSDFRACSYSGSTHNLRSFY